MLIGKQIKIINSKNKIEIGYEGKIVNETKFTIIIEHNNNRKRLIKKNITFVLGKNIISGEDVIGNAEDRIKKFGDK